MDEDELRALDEAGYTVLEALSYVRAPEKASAFTPHLFTCVDGRHYWIKAAGQEGLVAEVIAGRLAKLVNAGPEARITRVTPEVLVGTGVGG
jgi:hypothetical protein